MQVICAECDPLVDDCLAFRRARAQRRRRGGMRVFEGVVHGFYTLGKLIPRRARPWRCRPRPALPPRECVPERIQQAGVRRNGRPRSSAAGGGDQLLTAGAGFGHQSVEAVAIESVRHARFEQFAALAAAEQGVEGVERSAARVARRPRRRARPAATRVGEGSAAQAVMMRSGISRASSTASRTGSSRW